jgi:hypothetical protein
VNHQTNIKTITFEYDELRAMRHVRDNANTYGIEKSIVDGLLSNRAIEPCIAIDRNGQDFPGYRLTKLGADALRIADSGHNSVRIPID